MSDGTKKTYAISVIRTFQGPEFGLGEDTLLALAADFIDANGLAEDFSEFLYAATEPDDEPEEAE